MRDGRKVASSYFYKLGEECYDDRSTAALAAHARDRERSPAAAGKKILVATRSAQQSFASSFKDFSQFERIRGTGLRSTRLSSIHFRSCRTIANTSRASKSSKPMRQESVICLISGAPFRDEHAQMFTRPHNVNRPEDRLLDADQTQRFERIASPMMTLLGYAGKREYVVNFNAVRGRMVSGWFPRGSHGCSLRTLSSRASRAVRVRA